MKILFLDIDGVLNCVATFVRRAKKPITKHKSAFNIDELKLEQLDETLVARLNDIVEQTKCNIVLSSAWRLGYPLNTVAGWLEKKGFKYPEVFYDTTPNLILENNVRGWEIKTWLSQHPKIEQYAIVDDDIEDIIALHPTKTVRTTMKEGLTAKKVKDIIMILNN